jgi:endonuclease/exonuclease/phosphatase family metal-dependent hydrolase
VPGLAIRLLFWNTYLLKVGAGPGGLTLHEKPLVETRAPEVGAAVRDAYDVTALAEVFRPQEVAAVLAGAGVDPEAAVRGPATAAPSSFTSSGLLTFARHPIVRTEQVVFRTRGRRLRDSDVWSRKGVLMVELDLGLPGNLEVFSTHLFYGGDLLWSGARHRSPEIAEVRQAQVHELLGFVDAVHHPANVALVVGDFNIDAEGRGADGWAQPGEGAEAAALLRGMFDDAGFDDAWTSVGDGPGWTCDLVEAPDERFEPDPAEPHLCAEPAPAALPGDQLSRIDHAYLQRPTPSHRLDVRIGRFRRRAFPRSEQAPDHDVMATLSDHLGLHLELEVHPRA